MSTAASLLFDRLDGESWVMDALCGVEDHPLSLFFPPAGVKGSRLTGEARAVCDRCPVRAECRTWGADKAHGVFGGTSPEERGTKTPGHVGPAGPAWTPVEERKANRRKAARRATPRTSVVTVEVDVDTYGGQLFPV
jgi:WhiB family redox-sensing transcriptional regulator